MKATSLKQKIRKTTLIVFFVLCTISSIAVCLWIFKDDIGLSSITRSRQTPQPERYQLLKKDLKIRKQRLKASYLAATTNQERQQVLSQSRDLLESILPEMMRTWLGTPWDFNGTTETPGNGAIACGYFVSTVMRDAGFDLHRHKLAQQPSQTILKAFVPRSNMHIRTGMDYSDFCDWVRTKEKGIYIVGLDKHVGFIVHDGQGLHFIHSSGSNPWCVVDETGNDAHALKKSHYRVIGNLTAQKATLLKWLNGEKIYPVS